MKIAILNSTSVKVQCLVSIGANVLCSIGMFCGGLAVDRGLGPSGYGDRMFLLGSSATIGTLIVLEYRNL